MQLVRRNERERKRVINRNIFSVLRTLVQIFLRHKERQESPDYIVSIEVLYMKFVRRNQRRRKRERGPITLSVLGLYLHIFLRQNKREKAQNKLSVLRYSTLILYILTKARE